MAVTTSDLLVQSTDDIPQVLLLVEQTHPLLEDKHKSARLLKLKQEYLEPAKDFAQADMLAEMYSALKGAEKFGRTFGFE
ncbi:MAG: hypothetical protein IH840_02735 [Candidatus Heimdallarchaeota archaeon]|nr:hypothetical protein [Candidatus Heimdallarchaeota archaeon]